MLPVPPRTGWSSLRVSTYDHYMTIIIRKLDTIGGGTPAVTSVTDTFGRSTLNPTSSLLWAMVPLIISPSGTNPSIGDPFCNGASQIVLSGVGSTAVGTYYSSILPCIGLTFS